MLGHSVLLSISSNGTSAPVAIKFCVLLTELLDGYVVLKNFARKIKL